MGNGQAFSALSISGCSSAGVPLASHQRPMSFICLGTSARSAIQPLRVQAWVVAQAR